MFKEQRKVCETFRQTVNFYPFQPLNYEGRYKKFRKTTDFHLFQTLYYGEFFAKWLLKRLITELPLVGVNFK